MGFRKLRGVKRTYNVQGEIYFRCRNYTKQDAATKQKILRLVGEVAEPEYQKALLEYLRGDSVQDVAMRHCCSESQLYKLRKNFYEKW